jgi:hypothetical protein
MCTELLLAVIYFLIIAIINFFLFKLLKNYLSEINKRQHIKTIFDTCKLNQGSIFPFLYKYSNQQNNRSTILKQLSLINGKNDFLIIGNTYKYLSELNNNNSGLDNVYFKLLENQCLRKN